MYQAASVWNKLSEYKYSLTYGYKNKLYEINLTFSPNDFPHLAGFQYLKDLALPKYNRSKILSRILNGTLNLKQIQKATQYEKMVLPRLEVLVQIKDALDNDFNLFSYMPDKYPFHTQIKADYLISHHSDIVSLVFIVQSYVDDSAQCNYLCCSTFKQGERNYESNQRPRVLLKKERIHINSGSSAILLDKLSSQN
nr:PBECR4 domain-containing protein [Aequitasia blattaphilus]